RSVAWAVLIAYILFGQRPRLGEATPVAGCLLAAAALAALHIVPLPPSVWTALPGRELLTQAAAVIGEEQPWRPLSISPGATINALSSLIVPVVILLLVAAFSRTEHWRTATMLLALIVASALLAIVQF